MEWFEQESSLQISFIIGDYALSRESIHKLKDVLQQYLAIKR
jgi:hypothetical protein